MIKFKVVEILKEVIACDVSPVAMFYYTCNFTMFKRFFPMILSLRVGNLERLRHGTGENA